MLITTIAAVLVFAFVMGVLVITPVLFRRKNMTGDLFDPYYEHQCIDYVKSWWLILIHAQDDYLNQRHHPVYIASLLSLLSVLVALGIERGHGQELAGWFAKWQQHTPAAEVQLYLMLVGWQLACQQRPAMQQAVLLELLQHWHACHPQYGASLSMEPLP